MRRGAGSHGQAAPAQDLGVQERRQPGPDEKWCAPCRMLIIAKKDKYCPGCLRLHRRMHTIGEKIKKARADAEDLGIKAPEWDFIKGMVDRTDAGTPDHKRALQSLQEIDDRVSAVRARGKTGHARSADQHVSER